MKYSNILIAIALALPAVAQANQTKDNVENDYEIACLFCCDNSCNGSSSLAEQDPKDGTQEKLEVIVAQCFPGGGCEDDKEEPV